MPVKTIKTALDNAIGKVVHITTATFAYRGKLIATDHEFGTLEGVAIVFETGEMAQYAQTRRGAVEELMPWGSISIARASIVGIYVWA